MMIKKLMTDILTNTLPIKENWIVFESLNDLDCNSGALYDYMIKNGLNKQYKIFWIIKNKKYLHSSKVKNVQFITLTKYNICGKIKIRMAKYLIWDNVPLYKHNNKQISIYLTHGFPAIKNVKGIINVPMNCNYFLITSKRLEHHAREQFSIPDNTKFIYAGLPRNDYLFFKDNELQKITEDTFDKVIIWMPTFRKAKNSSRNDSNKNFKFGFPLIEDEKQINEINNLLRKQNNLLIIKIHGGQDICDFSLEDKSNIKIITLEDEKRLNLNLYKLLSNTSALLTDYSSVSFDYLLLDKPIGYIIDDIDEYKLGFAWNNVFDYMPGEHIKNITDFIKFLNNVNDNIDNYSNQRKKVLNYINDYKEINCERILKEIGVIK